MIEKINIIDIKIDPSFLTSLLTLVIATSGTMGAIMVGFVISKIQSIDNNRSSWYFAFKNEIRRLTDVLHNLPDVYFKLCEPLDKLIKYLESLNINTDFFTEKIDWKTIQLPSDIIYNDDEIYKNDVEIYKLMQSMVRIEEYIRNLSVNWISTHIIGKLLVNSTIKLFTILTISLITLVIYQIASESYLISKYFLLILTIIFPSYFIIVIYEIAIHLKDHFKDVSTSNETISKEVEEFNTMSTK